MQMFIEVLTARIPLLAVPHFQAPLISPFLSRTFTLEPESRKWTGYTFASVTIVDHLISICYLHSFHPVLCFTLICIETVCPSPLQTRPIRLTANLNKYIAG